MTNRILRISMVNLLCATMLFLSACENKAEVQRIETAATTALAETVVKEMTEYGPTEAAAGIAVDTVYLTLQLSDVYEGNYRHVEITEGEVTMEVFYMVSESGEKELFRVYFGEYNVGNMIGVLRMDKGDIPVALTVCGYSPEDFGSEEEMLLFNTMMEEMNTVVASICSDTRFVDANKMYTPILETSEENMAYWNVNLPQNMELKESASGKVYQADFYGNVAEEKIKLYTVYLGDVVADTTIGTFLVDGERRPVSVSLTELKIQEDWTEDDITDAYTMMSTVNDVIQAIMSNENFSEQLPE